MSVAELLTLRANIDKMLRSHRAELEAQLSRIERPMLSGRAALKGKKVPAKYRHPKTGQQWSGRGAIAKWLVAEIEAGKKRESFLIR